MRQYRVARRYAESLITAAVEQKLLEKVAADCESLSRLIRESREFRLFLKSPVIKGARKQELLREMVEKKVQALTLSFLLLLAEKGREDILDEIMTQFFALRDDLLGIVSVDLKAATQLSDSQQESIRKKFEGITRKKVRLAFSLEKELKGGFIARVGDTMFDGSIKRQLELLRERFGEGIGSN